MSRGRRIALVLVGAVALALVTAGGALFTIPLPTSFVAPRIAGAVESRLGKGYQVDMDAARVDPGTSGLQIKLDGFEIRDPSGTTVLRVPTAAVALDGNFLFGNDVKLQDIRLVEPDLTLRIEANGDVSLAAVEGAPPLFRMPAAGVPQAAPAELLGFIATAQAMLSKSGPLANFRSAEVVHGNIVIDDRRRNRVDHVDGVDLRILRRSGGNGLVASASSTDVGNRWGLTATLSGKAGETRDLDIGFQNLDLGRLVYEAVGGDPSAEVGGQLFGHLFSRIGPEGHVLNAEARIEAQNLAVVSREDSDARLDIQRARFQVQWDGVANDLRLLPSEIVSGERTFVVAGQSRSDADGEHWPFVLTASERPAPAKAGSPASDPNLVIEHIEMKGGLDRPARKLVVASATVRSPVLQVAGNGTVDFSGTPRADIALAGSDAPIAALLRLWPTVVAPQARNWVAENVKSGLVEQLSLAMSGPIREEADQSSRSLAVDLGFRDAAISLVDDVPPALGVAGSVQIRDGSLKVSAKGGQVTLGPGRTIAIKDLGYMSADFRPDPFQAELDIDLDGSIAALGEILESPDLSALAPHGGVLKGVEGRFAGLVRLTGAMGKGSNLNKLGIAIKGATKDLAIADLGGGHKVDAGDFQMSYDLGQIVLSGDAKVDGAPITLTARAERDRNGVYGKTQIAFTADPSKLDNFALGSLVVAGPVSARVTLPDLGELNGAEVEADLVAASVSGLPGLSKPAGQAANLAFKVAKTDTGWSIGDLDVNGTNLRLKGDVTLNGDGVLQRAHFPAFGVSSGDDARLDVERSGNAYRITIDGSAVDVRPFLKDILGGPDSGDTDDISLDAKLGTAIGYNGAILTGLNLKTALRGGTLQTFQMSGRIGQGAIEGRLMTAQDRRVIGIRAQDAGAVFRFFNFYGRIAGGALDLDVALGTPNSGVLVLRDFRVVGEQALNNVVDGREQSKQKARQNGYAFTKLRAKFQQGNSRISVQEANVWGPEIGATMSGELNYGSDQVEMRGTFVPVYALNNFFGRLPVIGALLGGSKEGLLGITFEVTGPMASPVVRVNPLSAVAPGFLRKLFEFRDSTPGDDRVIPQQPPAQPPQQQSKQGR